MTSLPNLSASIHQRLLNQSRKEGIDFNLLLGRFAIERFLYRLASSPFKEQFVLKGAILLQIWLPEAGRPTRDLDLFGFGYPSPDHLQQIFAAVCDQPVEPDGVRFLSNSITVRSILEHDEYGGQRVTLAGQLGSARLHVQVDIGIGDRPTPPPEWIEYPVLLDLPRPYLFAYRPETTIAEKLHAMIRLDLQNSRMKDFFDVLRLSQTHSFSSDLLVAAILDTFARRQTPIPTKPTAFTPEFAAHPPKILQWRAFRRKSGLQWVDEDFGVVVTAIARFLQPVIDVARHQSRFPMTWQPGGPWLEPMEDPE
jgi:hypothetical protein